MAGKLPIKQSTWCYGSKQKGFYDPLTDEEKKAFSVLPMNQLCK